MYLNPMCWPEIAILGLIEESVTILWIELLKELGALIFRDIICALAIESFEFSGRRLRF